MAAERSAAGEALPAHLAAVPSGAATKHSRIAHGGCSGWIDGADPQDVKLKLSSLIATDQDRSATISRQEWKWVQGEEKRSSEEDDEEARGRIHALPADDRACEGKLLGEEQLK